MEELANALILILVPVVIAAAKAGVDLLGKTLPPTILPMLAPVVALAGKYLLPMLGVDTSAIPIQDAAALGLAGVGLREVTVKATRVVTGS